MYEMMELISLKRKKNIFIFLFLALLSVFYIPISVIAESSIHNGSKIVLTLAVAVITILLELFITNKLSKYFRRISILSLPLDYTAVGLSSISDIPDYVPKYHIAAVYVKRGSYRDVEIKFVYTDKTEDYHLSLSMEEAEKFIVF